MVLNVHDMQIIQLMLSNGATNYELLEVHKINLNILVYEYGLSMSVLQQVSKLKYRERKELDLQDRLYHCCLILDLVQILGGYVVCK